MLVARQVADVGAAGNQALVALGQVLRVHGLGVEDHAVAVSGLRPAHDIDLTVSQIFMWSQLVALVHQHATERLGRMRVSRVRSQPPVIGSSHRGCSLAADATHEVTHMLDTAR